MKKIKKQLEVEIEIPSIPNFIRYGERKTLPIGFFTEEELQEIGEEWTKALIKKAREKSKEIK